MISCDSFGFRLPERELPERPALLSRQRLRGECRRLAPEVLFDEEVVPDALQAARGRGEAQRGLVGHRAHDERGDVVRVPETDACLVSGVCGLDELVCGSEIRADDDVDVLLFVALGFLRFAHALLLSFHRSTSSALRLRRGARRVKKKTIGAPDGIRTHIDGALEAPAKPFSYGSMKEFDSSS